MKRILFALVALLLNLAAVALPAQNPGQARPAGPPLRQEMAKYRVPLSILQPTRRLPALLSPCAGAKDSAIVAGALAGSDGGFRIQACDPANTTCVRHSIGFGPR